MSIKFSDTKGKAIAKKIDAYEYKDGENIIRLIGDILPRYVYWIKGTNDKDIPVECLAFDRLQEKFTNAEVDHVPKYFPNQKCSWSYSANCIDPADGKSKVLNLKKKLFEQIIDAAGQGLGDPTDINTGWDVIFKKTKTGPLPFNVEYTLQVLKCKNRALTDAEKEVAATAEDIDKKYKRPTADEVKKALDKITNVASDDPVTDAGAKEAISDLTA